MASKFFRGFSRVFKGPSDREGFGSGKRFATIGGVKPKVSTKKADQIKRSNKLIKDLEKTMKKDMSPQMRKRGEKLKKEVQKTQKEIYRTRKALGGIIQKFKKKARPDNKGQKLAPDQSKKLKEGIREKKAEGGILGRAKKFLGKETPKRTPKSEAEIKKITSSDAYKKADFKTKTKMLGGNVSTRKEMEDKIKKQKPSIKEKILPQKKKDRLNELRKELGMKKGGSPKKKFPDLTGDGKVTRADILKGRGVFRKGGASK